MMPAVVFLESVSLCMALLFSLFLRYTGTSSFSASFTKRGNFLDVLFAALVEAIYWPELSCRVVKD